VYPRHSRLPQLHGVEFITNSLAFKLKLLEKVNLICKCLLLLLKLAIASISLTVAIPVSHSLLLL
jgi:hypothetical protein